jgi:hypothetical protein
MDKKDVELIINALRATTMKRVVNRFVLNSCSKRVQEGFLKNGSPKWKYHFQCNHCKDWFRESSSLEIDHIEEIGSFMGDWTDYINRMFCDASNLQALCVACHKRKTALNASKRFERKIKRPS